MFSDFNLVDSSIVGSLAFFKISTLLMFPSWEVLYVAPL